MALSGVKLLDYACLKFQEECYDEALDAFVLAYSKGVQQEWILENIYNCYMYGNEAEFRKTYESLQKMTKVPYEDCILDFIPYKDGEYYVYDKELQIFLGKVSVTELQEVEKEEIFQKTEFSAAAIVMDWNWEKEKNILAEAKERRMYAVCHDIKRSSSYYKIPELSEYFQNVKLFSAYLEFQNYFHTNTAEYLPRIIFGNEESAKKIEKIIDEEHQYRLTEEGRNTSNVLLTISIPTSNRGHLALERINNLCSMPYDAEVEFVVSKNDGILYEEEYERIEKKEDARINYYAHREFLKAVENWHYAVEMAHGKYVLLVSDEDDVIIGALEHYLKLLYNNPGMSLMRARTTFQYHSLCEKKYGKKGLDAFFLMFLRQNYLSGLILHREAFLEENLLQLERFSDNPFYCSYPHEWWCAMLSRRGDYMEEPVALIDEKESVNAEEAELAKKLGISKDDEGLVKDSSLPVYATYEARLKQFQGQIDFLKWFMKDDKKGMELGLEKAFGKTSYLLELAREYNYKIEKFDDFVDQFLWMCLEVIDEVSLEEAQKINLLQWAQNLGLECLDHA